MLENWCWTAKQLKTMSSHYQRKGESLPDDLIAAIIKSKNVNQGLFNLRQLFFGLYDMTLHTKPEDAPELQDLTKLWCDLREEVSLVTTYGEYKPGQSGFAHITGGYSAGYYGMACFWSLLGSCATSGRTAADAFLLLTPSGYLYSQVFSADVRVLSLSNRAYSDR